MRIPVLALLLVLALPLATGQGPAPPPCGPLTTSATNPANPVAPGERVDLSVSVTNGGARAVDVVVAFSSTSPGWTILNPEDQQGSLTQGQSATFTFGVRPDAQASGDFAGTFAITGTCAIPVAGLPCPQEACVTSPSPVGVAAQLARPSGGGLPGIAIEPEYLVAGVVLVGVAAAIPLLLRRKGGAFAAECPEPLKMVRAGRGTSFPIELRNGGAQPLTAQFEIGPVPEGWTAFMPLPEVQLAPRETRSLWLMVRAPAEAQGGEAAEVELRLRSPGRPASMVRVRAEVQPEAPA